MTLHVTTASERQNDQLLVARVLSQLDLEGQSAAAYDHASHGCPFEDTEVQCPVCDPTEQCFI